MSSRSSSESFPEKIVVPKRLLQKNARASGTAVLATGTSLCGRRGYMELIVVILAGCVLAIPVMAIVALVRTGKLRDSLDERFEEQMDKIRDLEAQVSGLDRK